MLPRALPLLMAGLLLTSFVVAPVAAQTTLPDTILLDQDSEEIGQTTIDGQTYTVYSIDSSLWYASGIEVYVDGEKVTSKSEAEAAIRAVTQQQAIAALGSDDLETLRAIDGNMTGMANATTPTTAELDATTALLEAMKSESIDDDRTAWDAVNESAVFGEFNETQMPELREDVHQWETAAEGLHGNTTALIELVEQHEAGEDVASDELYQQYVATMIALETFEDRTDRLSASLSATALTSGEMATAVYGVPDHGEELTLQFAKLGHQLQLTAEHVEERTMSITDDAAALEDLQSMAESGEREMLNGWDTRDGAVAKVYQTLVGVPLLFVALGGVAYWRFRL